MSLTSLQYSHHSMYTDRTMESLYTTISSAHPQCAAGTQSISETDAAAFLLLSRTLSPNACLQLTDSAEKNSW